jgi:hypothetical protein
MRVTVCVLAILGLLALAAYLLLGAGDRFAQASSGPVLTRGSEDSTDQSPLIRDAEPLPVEPLAYEGEKVESSDAIGPALGGHLEVAHLFQRGLQNELGIHGAEFHHAIFETLQNRAAQKVIVVRADNVNFRLRVPLAVAR